VARWNHPAWWITRLQQELPEHWQAILEANNRQPPMTLRVNRRQGDVKDYLATLQAAGSVAVFADLRAAGHRPSLNLLWALEGALTGQPWQQVAQERRAALLSALGALEAGNARRAAYNRRP